MSQSVHKDFFISYTHADARWAEWIAWQLEEAGYSVILQAWDFRPGANFVSEMERAISNVKRTIAVLSPQYLNALYTQPEWAAAFKRDPKGEQGILVPVRIQECEVTGLLGQIIYVDLVGQDEGSASKFLLAGVRHERAKPQMAPAFPKGVQHTVSKQFSFPGDLPSMWNVPYPRDPLFVGREQVLHDLHATLQTKHQVALTSMSAGSDPSNIGVRETAVEYVYRYQSDYHVILWVHASSRQTLLSDSVGIATLLNIPQNSAQGPDEMVNAVKHWLHNHTQWLLVMEDVQDPEVIEAFIPSMHRGALLLTTHVPSVSQRFSRVEMDRMKPEEQTLLLQLSRMVGATLESAQRRMPLGLERLTIGRTQDNQLVLNDLAVSSHHAEILLKEQGYWITDVGSTNGTFVNQQMLDRHVPYLLHPRDVIRISTTTFTYEVDDPVSSKLLSSAPPAMMTPPSAQNVLPSSSEEVQVGEHVSTQLGNYRLVRLIGQGGFAEVYLGEHIHLDTKAAIKVLSTKLAKDDSEPFRQEARTIARLVHPHIVRVLDFGVEGTTPFLVMDYAPGETLRELHPKGTRLSLETVVSYVKQIALALDYAHEQKVIHRDVKPENMLIGRNGEVLLSDFGIALITQSSRYESSLDMAGTIAYMAPEQIEAHARPASDQYSLGIVVYEWLTGDRPFHGSFREIAIKHSLVSPPSLIEQVPELSPAVEQVVFIALAKEPKQRFGSVLAFATALEQASQIQQPEPEPVVLLSETTAPNQSLPMAEIALPAIPILQQAVSEGAADTPIQPDTIIPSQGEERPHQIEEVNPRQTEEEQVSQTQEQGDTREEERVREAKEPALAAKELTTLPHHTAHPSEIAHAAKPPALQADARVKAKPPKPSASWRFVLLALAGLVMMALASGIVWYTVHHASPTANIHATPTADIHASPTSGITEFPVRTVDSKLDGITAGPDGNLWFTQYAFDKIGRISPSGTITQFPLSITGLSQSDTGQKGITAGPDGNLWFTEYNAIGRISPSGTFTEFPLPTACGQPLSCTPYGITAGPDGNLWFTESEGDKIGRISLSGTITEFPLPTGSGPYGITTGPDRNLWFTEHYGGKIGRISLSGTITEFPLPKDYGPYWITAGPDRNLWFTEEIGNKVGRITLSGIITQFSLPAAGSHPVGITTGPDGNLWFTEYYGDQIGRITPSGTITEFPLPTAKSGPYGITTGPDRNLWFTESDGNQIGRITPSGT